MRWYNPPGEEEYKISYTKEGELTHFEHVLPDTLAGDSLPENIAINIAKMFLKDMTSSEWKDEDWEDYYYLTDDIIDAAVLWKRGSYISGTYMCFILTI